MAKEEKGFNFSGFVAWIVGVLVSLAVGSGMIQKVLVVPGILPMITQVAGWIVVIGAVISVIAAIFSK